MTEGGSGDSAGLADILADTLPAGSRFEAPELAVRLEAFFAAPSVEARVGAWADVVHWTRRAGGPRASPEVRLARLLLLLETLEGSPEIRARAHDAMTAMLAETHGAGFFGQTGLPSHRGFFSEFGDRLMGRVLPAPRDARDLSWLLRHLFPGEDRVEHFRRLPPQIIERLIAVLCPADRPRMWEPVRAAFADGFRLLAARLQSEGLSRAVRARGSGGPVAASPFWVIARRSDAVLEAWDSGAGFAAAVAAWREVAADCRAESGRIRQRLDTGGISIDIVFGLDAIARCLSRMEAMVEILESPEGPARAAAVHRLLSQLIAGSHRDRSLRDLFAANTRLLARKIVDRSGKTGEHYVARGSREYRHIWLAAAGGGLLTVLTAAVKMRVVGKGLPPFPEGFLASLNFAVSFLLLQAFGLVLATKQPAMTAATLAAILRDRRGANRDEEIVQFTADITRSQIAAAVGNVALVALGAHVFDEAWQRITGRTYLDPQDARYVVETLSPVDSLTVLYAAQTGVLLWLASVIGGWFDNWAAYHGLAAAIAEHPLGRWLGRRRLERAADAISRNASGWGTNVSLGFLLGMTPAFGRFFGLPLDVRHVTLSTGTLALAAAGIDQPLFGGGWLLRGVAGIAVMFVLNLGVSFLLSLFAAARAYEVSPDEVRSLLGRLLRRFVRQPAMFLWPVRRDARPAPSA